MAIKFEELRVLQEELEWLQTAPNIQYPISTID
jgi:hypothetical protein